MSSRSSSGSTDLAAARGGLRLEEALPGVSPGTGIHIHGLFEEPVSGRIVTLSPQGTHVALEQDEEKRQRIAARIDRTASGGRKRA